MYKQNCKWINTIFHHLVQLTIQEGDKAGREMKMVTGSETAKITFNKSHALRAGKHFTAYCIMVLVRS